ncbi:MULTISPECIES: protein kinase domain-containing protein [Streptomyces]|uniref:protein kinase domain-containing protein n=1 Tax=Streptomyces TaxID=1883 RepID=UPI00345B88D0
MAVLEPLRETTPRRIGPYELLARLGSGGMGDVHLARGPEGTVALKTVRADLAGEPGFRARFRREIAVARSVDSPHVARLTGGDADADPPWLATEYVPGPTLAEAVRLAGPLPAATVQALGAHLVRALHAVHAAPALHRDLKPGNVLLAADGPRLIDFGIARAPDATTLTGTGLMVGTPAFMSPEHIRGGRHVVAASDVFCLASVLCYAATGEDPFGDGPLAAVLHRVLQAKADLSSVPDPLRGVLADCLRPDPADRPGTAALATRFGTPPTGDFAWPAAIRERIAGDRAEAAAAAAPPAHPLAGYAMAPAISSRRDGDQPPAGHPAVPGRAEVRTASHDLPTLGAPQAEAGRPARGVVKFGIAGVAALAVGGAVVFGIWQGARSDGDEAARKPEAAAPGKAPAAGQDGVDEAGGPDRAGTLPAPDAAARPAGRHAWSGKLSKGPLGCTADATALVCQLVDGSYEAVGAGDGKQLWRYDPVKRPEETGSTAMISPTGLIMIPGGGLPPALRSGTAVLAAGGRIQARDAASGKVRWEKSPEGAGAFKGKPLVVDGRAFVGVNVSGQGYDMYAYDLSDGRELWHKRLASVQLARAFQQDFAPVAAKGGIVYARSERGVSAYDAATGAERGESEPVENGCGDILVQGGSVLCGRHGGSAAGGSSLTLHQLDARNLAAGPDVPLADATARRDLRITAVNDKVVVGVDEAASRVVVADRTGRTPEVVRTAPKSDAPFPRTLASAPLIVGDRLLFATNTALVLAPLDAGQGRAVAVEGAPGDRSEPAYDKKNGVDIAKSVRPPIALPVGGVVHIVYDQGTIRSVELPH